MQRAILALAAVLSCVPALGAEGMWLPRQLPALARELKNAGLQMDPSSLVKLTEHPMNAVIDLGGCTASFVSPQGLVITNHHCTWGALQYNSTAERNLLDDGFLAAELSDEIPAAPGSRVRVTVEVTDVTERMIRGLDEIRDGSERYKRIEDREKEIVAECEQEEGYRCNVRGFYGGHEYFLYKQLEIRDVRLVYAPPGSVGVFGGDIDNWMWPRHTGDFAFQRAYVGPGGKPADYSPDNVPYTPRHWLRVQPGGVAKEGFVMVVGYPGRTNRYRLADEVANAFEWSYPARKKMVDEMLGVIEEQTELHPEAEIPYASTVSGLNNATKNWQGQLDGFAGSRMVERKTAFEDALQQWIDGSEDRKREHGSTLARLRELVAAEQSTQARDLVLGMMHRSSMLGTARSLYRLSREREKPDAQREPGYQERDMTPFRQRLQRLDRRYHPAVDQAIWERSLRHYLQLPADQRVAELDSFLQLDDPDGLPARLENMYTATELDDGEKRLALMDAGRAALEASDDPFVKLAIALYDGDRRREAEDEARAGDFQLARSRYMDTVLAYLAGLGKTAYPDANSSLRVTYGNVRGYSPRDGMFYTPFTRLEGIVEKYTGEEPFDAPAPELEKIAARDHGPYALPAVDSVPVNFLSTVDTTGGNSGSPTLNGRGELVGLLFDGTYDSINSDWDFDETKTRSIHVDIRYILWVMDKVDHARRVLAELDF